MVLVTLYDDSLFTKISIDKFTVSLKIYKLFRTAKEAVYKTYIFFF